jgi:transposase
MVKRMRVTTLLNRLLELPGLRVSGAKTERGGLVITVARKFRRLTCPECGTQVRGRFEEKTRRWRHLSVWGSTTHLEGPIRRLRCPECEAVRTEEVPWARPGSAFTRAFEDAVALLAQQLSKTAVSELVNISWQTVGSIAERVVAEHLGDDRFANLRRIGVDEISYRRNHRYLTVVADHDTGRVVWVGIGKTSETFGRFFAELGPERTAALELVSLDMSSAFIKAVREHAPQAKIVFDRFHVAQLANRAADEVRRAEVAKLRDPAQRSSLKGSRWAVLRRRKNRSAEEKARLSEIAQENSRLYRAQLLKDSFLDIFDAATREEAETLLKEWNAWAVRSRIDAIRRLAGTVKQYREGILAFFDGRFTNARLEGLNNKIRLLSHRAFGFHSAHSLIATIYLCCSGIKMPKLQLV